MTKRVLRVIIPVVAVTLGLPKSRKRYGNGGVLVATTKVRVFSNTSKVMFRECKLIQRMELTTSNLEMGRQKLVQNLNNRFYQDKIFWTIKSIQINLSRKQIQLCASCHKSVHNGLYDGTGIY